MMSPSSIALQTPTATASCPIATCRKPGSSPARKRSSTFSSKWRMSSISRSASFSSSLCRAPFLSSTLATAAVYGSRVGLAEQWSAIEEGLDPRWSDARLELRIDDEPQRNRAAALLAPAGPGRRGTAIRFFTTRTGTGVGPEAVIPGEVRVLRALSDAHPVGTQGPVWYVGGKAVCARPGRLDDGRAGLEGAERDGRRGREGGRGAGRAGGRHLRRAERHEGPP